MRNQQLLTKLLAANVTGKNNLGNIDFVEGKIVICILKNGLLLN
jgi:hypothetical protein